MTNATEQNCSLYSDLFKDLNGTRPDLSRFRALSLVEQQEEIDHISSTLADEIAAEAHADNYEDDSWYDGEAFRSAGWGTDEDYGGMIGGDSDLIGEW